jgi:hypothetical protein
MTNSSSDVSRWKVVFFCNHLCVAAALKIVVNIVLVFGAVTH